MSQTGFNPAYQRAVRDQLSTDQCVKGILAGETHALSYAITLVENGQAAKRDMAYEILVALTQEAKTTKSKRITITGAPGAGKSTFIEHFGKFLTAKGHKLAVLAVDPSSQLSQGSIMGDKTRMQSLSADPLAYIRPSSSGNMLGGVNTGTKEAIFLCESAGYEWVLVETVGVGQSEAFAAQVTDMSLLLLQPGAGDDVQGIKRGVLETTDLIIVNKSDGEQKDSAMATARSYASVLQLFQPRIEGYRPGVIRASSIEKMGFEEIYKQVQRFFDHVENHQTLNQLRQRQDLFWFDQMIRERALEWLLANTQITHAINEARQHLITGSTSGFEALNAALRDIKKTTP